jgi:hypothetical protein
MNDINNTNTDNELHDMIRISVEEIYTEDETTDLDAFEAFLLRNSRMTDYTE